ncbi:MAG: mucoidy inhibitor MuiA family protein [Aequorivita sp.]|nr:mucoidy inhibitor MuiA family protein [Aequorivita sp.]
MKNLLLLCFLLPIFLFANSEKPTISKIEKVTVYLEGASVERTSSINLLPGENSFIFNNLSPDIDENSIQISGLGDASILSIVFNIDYLEKKEVSEENKTLKSALEDLETEKNEVENVIDGFKQELQLLQQNQKINSDATDLSLEKVKEMSVYYRSRTTEIKNAIYKQYQLITDLKTKISDHQNELLKLDDSKKEQRGEITLKLNSKRPANLVLNIRYNIRNAGWFPLYDIRATNTSSPIEFSYKANVYQQSGTDWENVNVVLSTGDPTTNNSKPILLPRYLNFNNKSYGNAAPVRNSNYKYNPTIRRVTGTVIDDTGLPLPGVNVIEVGTSNGTQTDFDGNYTLDIQGSRELAYSYVGFETETLPIYAGTMNTSLKPGAALEEVVVTAYGASNNDEPDWLAQRFEGKAAGIQIRGTRSLNNSGSLLYIVDGVPVSENEMRNFDDESIADITILKDAATTARYGSRGANGVVVITTKNSEELSISTKEVGITNTRFEIKEKYTIKSNAEITVIEVDNFELPATYQYYAAPELNENVFLTATINNWEKFDLLTGEANIYFEGSYAGKSIINPQATADSLNLSLGIDPNIIVKREKLENFKSKSFLGSTRIIDKGYKIEVKNNKKTPITLVLEDRIPISENKEIKVEDIEKGTSDYNDKTGIIRWKIELQPSASEKREFTYTVKYPKFKKVYL